MGLNWAPKEPDRSGLGLGCSSGTKSGRSPQMRRPLRGWPAAGVGGDPLHDAGQTVQTGVPLRLQAACDQNQAEQLSKRKNKDPDLFLLLCLFDSFYLFLCVFNFPAFGFGISPSRNLNLKTFI